MRVEISRSVLDTIRRESAVQAPREACGLLFGTRDAISGSKATENTAENPETHFEIAPEALIAALRSERSGGPAIAGYWHSHPRGRATPSATDAAAAAPDGKIWIIVAGDAITAWRSCESGTHLGRFEPLELARVG